MVKINGHKLRRTVFWLILSSGSILITLVMLYYSGYRFSFKQGRVIRVGSLSVQVIPAGSSVFLNDVLEKQTTPVVFNSILPGEYTLRVEKSGHLGVQFPVIIHSQSTTVLEGIFLPLEPKITQASAPPPQTSITENQFATVKEVKEWPIWKISGSDPVAVISGPERRLSLLSGVEVTELDTEVRTVEISEDNTQLAYIRYGTIWLVDLTQGLETFILSRQTTPFVDLAYLPDYHAVVFTDGTRINLALIGSNQTISLITLAQGTQIDRVWVNSNAQTVLFRDQGVWFQIQLQD